MIQTFYVSLLRKPSYIIKSVGGIYKQSFLKFIFLKINEDIATYVLKQKVFLSDNRMTYFNTGSSYHPKLDPYA